MFLALGSHRCAEFKKGLTLPQPESSPSVLTPGAARSLPVLRCDTSVRTRLEAAGARPASTPPCSPRQLCQHRWTWRRRPGLCCCPFPTADHGGSAAPTSPLLPQHPPHRAAQGPDVRGSLMVPLPLRVAVGACFLSLTEISPQIPLRD